jgi:hypothetical protein
MGKGWKEERESPYMRHSNSNRQKLTPPSKGLENLTQNFPGHLRNSKVRYSLNKNQMAENVREERREREYLDTKRERKRKME